MRPAAHQDEYDLIHLALFMARPMLFYDSQPERWTPELDAMSAAIFPNGQTLGRQMGRLFQEVHNIQLSQPLVRPLRERKEEIQAQGKCPIKQYFRKIISGAEVPYIRQDYSIVQKLGAMLDAQGVDPLLGKQIDEEYRASLPIIRQNLRHALEMPEFQDFYARTDYLWRLTGYSAGIKDQLTLVGGMDSPLDLPFDPKAEPPMSREWAALCLATLENRLEMMFRQSKGVPLPVVAVRERKVCGPLIQVARRESSRLMQCRTPLDEVIMDEGLNALSVCRQLLQNKELSGLPVTRALIGQRVEAMVEMLGQRTDWVFDRAALDNLLAFSLKIPPSLPRTAPATGAQR